MKPGDPLGHEVSLADELARRGIKGSLNKRVIAAIARLLGHAVGSLRSPLQGDDERNADEAATMAYVAVQSVASGERKELGAILVAHYREILTKHANKRAVVWHALEGFSQTAQRPRFTQSGTDPVRADWLNYFAAYAEKASSEALRQTFGRILSGELQKPGAFSLSTLRIVSELDADAAGLFQGMAARAFSMDVTDPTPSALLKPEGLRGPLLHKLLKLEAMGLIQQVGGDFAISSSNAAAGALIGIRFGPLLLRGEVKTKAYFSLQLLKLTDAGAELCSIIPMDHHGAAREVGGLMAKRGLAASIHLITGIANGDVQYRSRGETVSA